MRILTNGYGYGYGCGGTTSDTRIDPVERRKAEAEPVEEVKVEEPVQAE